MFVTRYDDNRVRPAEWDGSGRLVPEKGQLQVHSVFQAVATSTSGWPMDRSQIVSPGAHSYPRETLPNSTLRSPRPRHRSLHRRPGNLRLQFHLCLRGEEHVEAHLAVVVVSREGLRPSRSRLRLQRRGSIHLHQEISDGLIVGGFREVVALSKAAIQRF